MPYYTTLPSMGQGKKTTDLPTPSSHTQQAPYKYALSVAEDLDRLPDLIPFFSPRTPGSILKDLQVLEIVFQQLNDLIVSHERIVS